MPRTQIQFFRHPLDIDIELDLELDVELDVELDSVLNGTHVYNLYTPCIHHVYCAI